jgi:hypothetical protein
MLRRFRAGACGGRVAVKQKKLRPTTIITQLKCKQTRFALQLPIAMSSAHSSHTLYCRGDNSRRAVLLVVFLLLVRCMCSAVLPAGASKDQVKCPHSCRRMRAWCCP